MRGKIRFEITDIQIRKYNHGCEMTFYCGENKDFLYIIGDNTLDILLEKALKNMIVMGW